MPSVETRGASIVYDDTGDETGRRPVVVLVHSVGLSTREGWRGQVPVLARNYRVITYDIRGLGESSCGDAPMGVETFTEDLIALLDHLGIDKIILMGVSLGSFIGQAFACAHGNRLTALALVSTACRIKGGNSGVRAARNTAIREHGMKIAAGPQIDSHFPDDFRAANSGLMDWYRTHYINNDPDAYIAIMEDLGRFDYCDRLAGIACPTLIIAGGEDASSVAGTKPGESARLVAAKIPGARLEIIKGAHHYPQIDHEAVFNAVMLDFFKTVTQEKP
ncbi:MAG: alpha/beta fold hydrolase [Rhodospirillales bacterium]|nr:alpha/beta fold hydrolase [Rhodospirillales bacterium]MBT4007448.1 alpha/beta fold hydrolase [Rhodospirillales bacterium]MBT5075552.1 alpha/beta fold hydrolase [Rhodospirillales bacterium]MBT5112475.1 alpha/beta fold hydrolase [Rhodospirillales bacterium]MBT5673344.1 alpha/beta fold hydrolase [Rhodospirillales bacterium]